MVLTEVVDPAGGSGGFVDGWMGEATVCTSESWLGSVFSSPL